MAGAVHSRRLLCLPLTTLPSGRAKVTEECERFTTNVHQDPYGRLFCFWILRLLQLRPGVCGGACRQSAASCESHAKMPEAENRTHGNDMLCVNDTMGRILPKARSEWILAHPGFSQAVRTFWLEARRGSL
jgi:hypothetical protein